MKGKVTLVGAGPGDYGLLTIKGKDAIEKAQVVIYDRLVGEEILKLIPKDAEKINAGKKSNEHLIPQERINEILLEKAMEGKDVVRLKGGDCFLFGRGGEELELLEEKGIQFEVIPGITSALAVPAYAGIPVTHRDYVSSVHIITGHKKKNGKLDIDFESCVKIGGTLVFLMGIANLEYIMKGLKENGMRNEMPCCIIEEGTRTGQRKTLGTIESINEKAKEKNIKSPAIIIVGEVCGLSEKFDWFEKLPLKGKTILITRPKERIGTIAKKSVQFGAVIIEYDCIEIKNNHIPDEEILKGIRENKWVVFTSPAGVRIFFERMRKIRKDSRILADKKIAVIGQGTADELEKYNIYYDLMPKKYYAKELGRELAERIGKMENEGICILRAEKGSKELTEQLKNYTDIGIYKTEYRNEKNEEITEKINNGEIDYVTFTSGSTVEGFIKSIGENVKIENILGICIGEKTAETAGRYGIKSVISKEVTIDSMIEKMIEVANK